MLGSRLARIAILGSGAALVLALTGCSQEFGGSDLPSGETNEDPGVLRTKIRLLTADQCYTGDPRQVYPRCAKFITQLDSTTGTVDQLLAPRGGTEARAARQLRSGVDSYQRLGCAGVGEPSGEQRSGCPAALRDIHDSLEVLGSG